MSTRSIVPFGPQHPVLPEPIHLDLVLEDEKVVEAVPSIGFVHRGLEQLVEKRDFQTYVYVAERISGICSFMHGMSYCEAVEKIMNIEPFGARCPGFTAIFCGWGFWRMPSALKACSCRAGEFGRPFSTCLRNPQGGV